MDTATLAMMVVMSAALRPTAGGVGNEGFILCTCVAVLPNVVDLTTGDLPVLGGERSCMDVWKFMLPGLLQIG